MPDRVEPICMECGKLAVLTMGDKVYPHRRDLHDKPFFVCTCGAKVGCHPGTTDPLGYPAGPATQQARRRAHDAFDVLWRAKAVRDGISRGAARRAGYAWLAEALGIHRRDCHISQMHRADADRVAALCRPFADQVEFAARHSDPGRPAPATVPPESGLKEQRP